MPCSPNLNPAPPPAKAAVPRPAQRWLNHCLAAAGAVGLLLSGCAEEPLPGQQLRSYECLENIALDTLPEHIRHCDAVVAAFPGNPSPLNDRYLLHSLAGNETAACADIEKAASLARSIPADKLDDQLRTDLTLRQKLCRQRQP